MKKRQLISLFILFFIIFQTIVIPASSIQDVKKSCSVQYNEHINCPSNCIWAKKIFRLEQTLKYFLLDHSPLSDFFHPEDINETDDKFHGSKVTYGNEWWYFDAMLNNQYTLQFSIHVYTVLNKGFATIQCNIYKHKQSVISERTLYPLSYLNLSDETPKISLNNHLIMYIQHDNYNQLLYRISYDQQNFSFDLSFTGITQGWKGTTTAGNWAVILPKALVRGQLCIENTTESVSGVGYHDHNWNVTMSTGLNFGWLWGKTNTDHYTLIWAQIFERWYKETPLLVVNENYNGYFNIPAKNIDLSITQTEFKNGMIIPYGFNLSAHSETYDLSLNISVINSDYITIIGLINYWRYHIHVIGTLSINNYKESIDDYNIAEFIRFRPY